MNSSSTNLSSNDYKGEPSLLSDDDDDDDDNKNKNNNNNKTTTTTISSIHQQGQRRRGEGRRRVFWLNESDEYFWGNSANITFQTRIELDTDQARICLHVKLQTKDSVSDCPFPHLRARLSGAALVHIPVRTVSKNNHHQHHHDNNDDYLAGCAWIPVPGLYFLEVNLLHCTMNPDCEDSNMMMSQCVLTPQLRHVKDFSFIVPTFQRNESSFVETSSVLPNAAWVYAPRCDEKYGQKGKETVRIEDKGDIYTVSEECTRIREPRMIRMKAQVNAYKHFMGYTGFHNKFGHPSWNLTERLDDYVYLPVDWTNGRVHYDSVHSVPLYAPPLPSLSYDNLPEKICFVGDSFGRHLFYEFKRMLSNLTMGTTGCVDRSTQLMDMHSGDKVYFMMMKFPLRWAREVQNPTRPWLPHLRSCQNIIINSGQWDAGHIGGYPTTPNDYKYGLWQALRVLQNVTAPETHYFVLSTDPDPLGFRVLKCNDWRVSPLLDAYNDRIRHSTVEYDGVLRRIVDFDNTFFLDNSDIVEPMWDEADDWRHPCRSVTRVVAYRVMRVLFGKKLRLER